MILEDVNNFINDLNPIVFEIRDVHESDQGL